MGDFNMKSILNGNDNYNHTLIKHMKDMYNFKQYITQNTTSHQSQLDLCFANRHMNTTTILNYWSDPHIISGWLKVVPLNNDWQKNGVIVISKIILQDTIKNRKTFVFSLILFIAAFFSMG